MIRPFRVSDLEHMTAKETVLPQMEGITMVEDGVPSACSGFGVLSWGWESWISITPRLTRVSSFLLAVRRMVDEKMFQVERLYAHSEPGIKNMSRLMAFLGYKHVARIRLGKLVGNRYARSA